MVFAFFAEVVTFSEPSSFTKTAWILNADAFKVEPMSCNLSFSFVVEVKFVFRLVFSVANTSFFTVNTLFSSCAFAKSVNNPVTFPFNSAIIDLASTNSLSVAFFFCKMVLILDFNCWISFDLDNKSPCNAVFCCVNESAFAETAIKSACKTFLALSNLFT